MIIKVNSYNYENCVRHFQVDQLAVRANRRREITPRSSNNRPQKPLLDSKLYIQLQPCSSSTKSGRSFENVARSGRHLRLTRPDIDIGKDVFHLAAADGSNNFQTRHAAADAGVLNAKLARMSICG